MVVCFFFQRTKVKFLFNLNWSRTFIVVCYICEVNANKSNIKLLLPYMINHREKERHKATEKSNTHRDTRDHT